MSANPPKRDAWPQPKTWRHVWVREDRHVAYPPPQPGLVLDWRKVGRHWKAWVVWIDSSYDRPRIRQEWLPADVLRPAISDLNVWNDGPRR